MQERCQIDPDMAHPWISKTMQELQTPMSYSCFLFHHHRECVLAHLWWPSCSSCAASSDLGGVEVLSTRRLNDLHQQRKPWGLYDSVLFCAEPHSLFFGGS